MALVKGKYINPDVPIKSNIDPVSGQDLSRKSYVDSKAVAEALSARLQAESFASSAASTAEQSAKSYADQKVSDLVNGAPAMLDTLKELADALEASEGSLEQQILTQVGTLNSRIDQEILDRQSGDSSEASARQAADLVLQTSIEEEVVRATEEEARIESEISNEISNRQAAVYAETLARQAADTALQTAIDEEQSRAEGEESRIEGKVDQEILDRQSAVSSEAAARQSADSALQTAIEEEQERAEGEEERIENKVDSEVLARQAAVSAEQLARETADMSLDARLDVLEADPTTKTYVDGKFSDAEAYTDQKVSDLVNGAPAMLDTLKELADAIGAQGGSLTEQILTQVGAVDDRVDQEISDRQAADLVLDGKITAEENRAEGEEARIEAKVDQEILDRQSAVSAEQSAREAADQSLQLEIGNVDSLLSQEVTNRQAAVSAEQARAEAAESALDVRIDVLEADPTTKSYVDSQVSGEQSRAMSVESGLQSQITQEISNRQTAVSAEQTRAEAAESALDARVDVLEAEPRPRGHKEIKTLTSSDLSNGYIDLSYEAMEMTVNMSVSAVMKYETEDYTVSVVSNKTRITFAGELLSNGASPLEEGEKVYFQYMTTNEVSSGGGGGGSEGGGGSGGGGGGSGGGSSEVTTYGEVVWGTNENIGTGNIFTSVEFIYVDEANTKVRMNYTQATPNPLSKYSLYYLIPGQGMMTPLTNDAFVNRPDGTTSPFELTLQKGYRYRVQLRDTNMDNPTVEMDFNI